jgi:transcriptional regulator with XRE-family HTH domain
VVPLETAIKKLRHKRIPKITQLELAKEIGVSEGLISQYEKGVRTPSVGTLVKLAKTFSKLLERPISIDDIIKY